MHKDVVKMKKKRKKKYEGETSNGLRHGRGVYHFSNGNMYNGDWKNDKQHGFGILTYSNGSRYEGNFKKGKLHGKGKLLWADGTLYSGSFYKGAKHGLGRTTYEGGGEYKGNYKNGVKHGSGKLTLSEGHWQKGKFENGQLEGVGVEVFPNGDKYSGLFKKGKCCGHGKYTCKSSKDVYEGEWKSNKQHGRGVLKYGNGSRYEGEWKEGKKHGKGVLVNKAKGSSYVGDYYKGAKHGLGKIFYANGRRYEGSFKKGRRHGEGKMYFRDGSIFEGQFKKDVICGKGKTTYVSGSWFEGTYKDNKKHGEGILYRKKNDEKFRVSYEKGKLVKKEMIGKKAPVDDYSDEDSFPTDESDDDTLEEIDIPLQAEQSIRRKISIGRGSQVVEEGESFEYNEYEGEESDEEEEDTRVVKEVRVKVKFPLDSDQSVLSLSNVPVKIENENLIFQILELFDLEDEEPDLFYLVCSTKERLTVGDKLTLESWIEGNSAPIDLVKFILKRHKKTESKKKKVVQKSKYEINKSDIEVSRDSLGRGSFGVVRKGTLKVGVGKVQVAVKRIHLSEDFTFEDAEREVRIMVEMNHDHIINSFGFYRGDDDENCIYVAMELCKGDLCKLKKRLKTVKAKLKVLLGISKAMHHLHLKTQNILITQNGKPVVTDFGTSKNIRSVNDTLCGTYLYMAPELWLNHTNPSSDGHKIDSKLLDVYSFGIIIYEVWSGKLPYSSIRKKLKDHVLMKSIATNDLRPDLKKIQDDCPSDLIQLMQYCWKSKPEERPGSFEVISEIIQEIMILCDSPTPQ